MSVCHLGCLRELDLAIAPDQPTVGLPHWADEAVVDLLMQAPSTVEILTFTFILNRHGFADPRTMISSDAWIQAGNIIRGHPHIRLVHVVIHICRRQHLEYEDEVASDIQEYMKTTMGFVDSE